MTNLTLKVSLKFHIAWIAFLLLALPVGLRVQGEEPAPAGQSKAAVQANSPAEDFSGMYSFLKEGDFIQITLDKDGVTGYISRQGDQDSDRGVFLDQWFSKASVKGYDLTFTTKPLHSVWFEFKGTFSRGPAKTKNEDGYYVLRGTLTEFVIGADKKTTSRATQVEFKLLAEPPEDKTNKD